MGPKIICLKLAVLMSKEILLLVIAWSGHIVVEILLDLCLLQLGDKGCL